MALGPRGRGRWVPVVVLAGVALAVVLLLWRGSVSSPPPVTQVEPALAPSPAALSAPSVELIEEVNPHGVRLSYPDGPGRVWLPTPHRGETPASGGEPDTAYVGAQACAECHQDRYETFMGTAHHHTSKEANAESVLGPLEAGRNRLETGVDDFYMEMTQEADGLYQNVHFRDDVRRFRFDLVTGSGKIGQTYLHWSGDGLYQHHASYLRRLDRWIPSPGFDSDAAIYARPVIIQCLACHATYFENLPGPDHHVNKHNYILGISCERCHGPGRPHIDHHRAHPTDKEARHMTDPGTLPPERLNDLCAQCHAEHIQTLRPALDFRPGDRFEDFYVPKPQSSGGVHTSNQRQRLERSPCWTETKGMTCTDCHDPHQPERGNLPLFSKRCQTCHEASQCGMAARVGPAHVTNCIDCHMPKRDDVDLTIQTTSGVVFPKTRDHLIGIHPGESERVLEQVFGHVSPP